MPALEGGLDLRVCRDCGAWKSRSLIPNDTGPHAMGECRRKSPVATANAGKRWPLTRPDDWCADSIPLEPPPANDPGAL